MYGFKFVMVENIVMSVTDRVNFVRNCIDQRPELPQFAELLRSNGFVEERWSMS